MRSKNKYDVFTWVMIVANSAVTAEQKCSALKLLRNFENQFNITHFTNKNLHDLVFALEMELYEF